MRLLSLALLLLHVNHDFTRLTLDLALDLDNPIWINWIDHLSVAVVGLFRTRWLIVARCFLLYPKQVVKLSAD